MAETLTGDGRPRPVAEMPPDALLDGELTAKRWLVAVIGSCPLAAVGDVPTAALADEGPALCAAILRALGSDRELARLQPGGDLELAASRAGRLAGADAPAPTAAAVALLRGAVWAAVTLELPRLDAATTGALAQRLAHVCDVVLQAALREAVEDAPHVGEGRSIPDATPLERQAGSEPWLRAAERLLRGERERPFAVLAVEADDVERLLAADPDGAPAALDRFERALRRGTPPDATVERDAPGRLWIVAPGAGRGDARALGERLIEAAQGAVLHHGVPLTLSIGIAVYPDDATDAASLAVHADEGLFAARAAGIRLA